MYIFPPLSKYTNRELYKNRLIFKSPCKKCIVNPICSQRETCPMFEKYITKQRRRDAKIENHLPFISVYIIVFYVIIVIVLGLINGYIHVR